MAITHETNGKNKTKQRGPSFSEGAAKVLEEARIEAALGQMVPLPPHLFLTLLEQGEVLPYLTRNGVDIAEARLYAEAALPESNQDERAFEQVIKHATYEAWREASTVIQTQHLLIALVRAQKWSDFPNVLESLGFNLAELRQQSLNARRGHQKYATGHPLNQVGITASAALDAAEAEMRASYCGRINTAHLLLGVLSASDSWLIGQLRQTGVDVDSLQRAARNAIHQDGEIATSTRRFTPAAQRALDRARDLAESDSQNTWAPVHLLQALMPRELSLKAAAKERLRYGGEIDDPAARVLAEFNIEFFAEPVPQVVETTPEKVSYTEGFQKVWTAAYLAAQAAKATEVQLMHLLYGMAVNPDSLAYEALQQGGAELEAWGQQVPLDWRQQAGQIHADRQERDIPPSPATQQVINRAVSLSHSNNYKHTGPEQFLYLLLTMAGQEKHPEAAEVLEGVDVEVVREFLTPYVICQHPKPESPGTLYFFWRPMAVSFVITGAACFLLQMPTWGIAVAVFSLQLLAMVLALLAVLFNHPAKHSLTSYIAGFIGGMLVWGGLFNLLIQR